MTNWHPVAIVLVVELRECGCGETYACPNHTAQLLLERHAVPTAKSSKTVPLPPNSEEIPRGLPRRLKYATTYIDHCHACWTTTNDRQLELFPEEAPTRPEEYIRFGRDSDNAGRTPTPTIALEDL